MKLVPISVAALALLAGSAAWLMIADDDSSGPEPASARPSKTARAPGQLTELSPRALTRGRSRLEMEVEVEVASLSIDEIRRQLPQKPVAGSGWHEAGDDPRGELLFQRLGALLGEQALDELIGLYGKETFAIYAVGQALEGWMKSQPDEATEVFLGMANGIGTSGAIQWNGVPLDPGPGVFSKALTLKSLGGVVAAATGADPEAGLSLLGRLVEPHGSANESELTAMGFYEDFMFFFESFASALPRGTDWMEVWHQLDGSSAIGAFSQMEQVRSLFANSWARRDLGAALDWHVTESTRRGDTPEDGLTAGHTLLRSLNDRSREVRWLEQNHGSRLVGDESIQNYGKWLQFDERETDAARLIALPSSEAVKESMLSSFVTSPTQSNDGAQHRPAFLRSLLEAAEFSSKVEARWRMLTESGDHIPRLRE